MYAHELICFFTKYEYFMYFLVNRFFTRFFVSSGPVSVPVHILGFTGSMIGRVPITLGGIQGKIHSTKILTERRHRLRGDIFTSCVVHFIRSIHVGMQWETH